MTPPSDNITRKDFLNAGLLGVGAALLHAPAPAAAMERLAGAAAPSDPWTGPGGEGDYALSNGNTKTVMDSAHRMRDGAYDKTATTSVADTGEVYDLVVVGGGITGLTTAYFFAKGTDNQKTCLVLDNHPIFGGEAKQNEFVVDGVRLIAPQGSNDFGVPRAGNGPGAWQSEMWDDLAMPREFTWSPGAGAGRTIRLSQDNYQPMEGIGEYGVDVGYFFDEHSSIAPTSRPMWRTNIWQNDLADVPISDDVRRQLLAWRQSAPNMGGRSPQDFARYLDTVTYKQFLQSAGYGDAVVKMIEPVVGLINGASPDAVSAHAAQQIGMPGVSRPRGKHTGLGLSFPGGNVTYTRHLVKKLIPAAISGEPSFEGILNGRVGWAVLDRSGQPTRVRVGATVVRVEHAGAPDAADGVTVIYATNGQLHRVRARRVAMASGGWVNKHVIAGLPDDIREAYSHFQYAPALIINVALTSWRFLAKMGVGAVRWFDDSAGTNLGFVANIRRQMVAGGYEAPADPDRPNVLTFYVGLYTPGRTAYEQGVLNRARLLATSYAEYEKLLMAQMTRQFASTGFDARRDVAGVILNRWGHARLVQPPGWYYGVNGQPAPREIVARGFGRIAIGHSELNGHQSATGAMSQGKRLGEWAATA